MREAKIPEPIAALPALVKACIAAYRADKGPRDADSIVFFPVRLAWTGSLAVAASGPVQCRPTP